MVATDKLSELLRLPIEERAKLALELIRSLDGEPDADAAAACDAEIERRGAEVDAGTAETMTLDGSQSPRSTMRSKRDRGSATTRDTWAHTANFTQAS